MLIAETRGKVLREALNHEDYLTSAVFGDLRLIMPNEFWPTLLERTKSSFDDAPLTRVISVPINQYVDLQTWFWPFHPKYGEPDLVLKFHRDSHPALVIVVEVKLWSGKSGVGEQDQLVRYLKLMEVLPAIGIPTSDKDQHYLLYLTPRDSLAEIKESLALVQNPPAMRQKLYRLKWQDICRVAGDVAASCTEPAKTILTDIAEFLHRRNLEYFDGYHESGPLEVAPDDGRFLEPAKTIAFAGMFILEFLERFEIERGAWVG